MYPNRQSRPFPVVSDQQEVLGYAIARAGNTKLSAESSGTKHGTRQKWPTQTPSSEKAAYAGFDNYMNKLYLALQTNISKTGELVY